MYNAIQGAERRFNANRIWLKENHPETFEEQKHCDEKTPERAYWHHGYMMGLRDFLGWIQGSSFTTNSEEVE